MDCFFFEGHKVLFRVALAKLKLFYKSVSDKKDLYKAAKKDGLYSTFSSHSKLMKIYFEKAYIAETYMLFSDWLFPQNVNY